MKKHHKPQPFSITRREFVNGLGGSLLSGSTLGTLAAFSRDQPAYPCYPPSLTGMRGNHTGAFEVAHGLAREGKKWKLPENHVDDIYDLVIVGAGISGLAAAAFYQQKAGKNARILILDNHDDFGGHAKRNEFNVDGKTLIGYGGSQSIDGPGTYSAQAKQLLESIAIHTDRFYDYYQSGFYNKWNLRGGLYFANPGYITEKLVADPFNPFNEAVDPKDIESIVNTFPISQIARRELANMMKNPKDHLAPLPDSEKISALRSISYIDYLQKHLGFTKESTDVLRDMPKGWWGVGWDALSALEAVRLSMPAMAPYAYLVAYVDGEQTTREPYIFHFPDGNAGIARSLVRYLQPHSVPGETMEDLTTARVNYALLDQASAKVKIRLNSTAINVQHTRKQNLVSVDYVKSNEVCRVVGKHVVLACYNNIIPHLCPELGQKQRDAIAYATKVPLVYTNIALRNWRCFEKLGFNNIRLLGSEMHHSVTLDFPVSMGDYHFSSTPDDPILVHATYVPTMPDRGLSAREQHRAGRHQLYQLTFDDFEKSLVSQMNGMLSAGGFDSARDIAAITVNRWPHGYAYEYNDYSDPHDWNPEKGPHIAGRAQIGRISIANSDASALAYVNGAIDAAYRAIEEQTAA